MKSGPSEDCCPLGQRLSRGRHVLAMYVYMMLVFVCTRRRTHGGNRAEEGCREGEQRRRRRRRRRRRHRHDDPCRRSARQRPQTDHDNAFESMLLPNARQAEKRDMTWTKRITDAHCPTTMLLLLQARAAASDDAQNHTRPQRAVVPDRTTLTSTREQKNNSACVSSMFLDG